MFNLVSAKTIFYTLGLYFGLCVLMAGAAHAAGGAAIVEFTGGTEKIFQAMRAVDFVRYTGVALFAILLIGGFGGFISGGWVTVLGGLLMLGAWFGAEPIVDTIFTAGAVL